jgi:LmbE family N-acetylglucosaminyl deacetylase
LLEEGLQPHKVREMLFWASENINFRSDVTATFDLKLAALRCHKSQVNTMRFSDLEDWLRKRCKDLAEGEDFELAEAFHREEIIW